MAASIALAVGSATSSGNTYSVPISLYFYGNGSSWSNYKCPWSFSTTGNSASGSSTYSASTSAQLLGSKTFTFTKASTAKTYTISAKFTTDTSIGTLTTSKSITVPAGTTTATINYYGNGATSGSMAKTTYTVASSGTINIRTNAFKRTGYSFYGWHRTQSKAAAGQREYTDGQKWNKNNVGPTYNLYAAWKINSYTLTATTSAGYLSETSGWTLSEDLKSATKSVTYNTAFGALPAFNNPGYHAIDGSWKNANGDNVSESTKIGAENTTIHVNWEPNTYKVYFHSNIGTDYSSIVDFQEFTYDEAKALMAYEAFDPPFNWDHHVFRGWNTNYEAKEVEYEDEQVVSNLTDSDNGAVHLYAIWSEDICTVVFNYLDSAGNIVTHSEEVGINSSGTLFRPNSAPEYRLVYGLGNYWKFMGSIDPSDPQSTPPSVEGVLYTDLVNDSNFNSDNGFYTNYVPAGTVGNPAALEKDYTFYFQATYVRLDSQVFYTASKFSSIRYPSEDVTALETLENSLKTGGIAAFNEENDEQGAYLVGVFTYYTPLDLSDNAHYQNILGDSITSQTIAELNPISSPCIQVSGRDINNINQCVIGTSGVDVPASTTPIYMLFVCGDTAPSRTYEIIMRTYYVKDGFGIIFSAGYTQQQYYSQGANYILDINRTGTMLSIGNVALDTTEDTFPRTIGNDTVWGITEVNSRILHTEKQPEFITALYNPIYAPVSDTDTTLMPIFNESKLEDTVILSEETIRLWQDILEIPTTNIYIPGVESNSNQNSSD